MKRENTALMTFKDLKIEHFGRRGTLQREAHEEGYQQFKIGAMIQEARIKRGMTQQELADKVGTTKSYISKIENNIKEARLSTLQKIVERGFGGKIELRITFG